MKFTFLGDVHGDVYRCMSVCNANPDNEVIQVGDLGVGWLHDSKIVGLPSNFKFFVGNHDNRTLAETYPNCLGHFGEYKGKFFFVSGAHSIDKDRRIPGWNWWPDEELNVMQQNACLDAWEKSKTTVLVAHDCPQSIAQHCFMIYDKCSTRNLLEEMIKIRKPEIIICGHHHRKIDTRINDIHFICLGLNQDFTLYIP